MNNKPDSEGLVSAILRVGLVVLLLFLFGKANSQTTVFSDDFSTNASASWTTSGQIGSSAWYVSRSGDDWGARRNTSLERLELTNDASVTLNVNGWVFAYTSTSSFSSPYNTSLNLNSGLITWFFNIRVNRSNLAGFTSGNYGLAFILGGTSASPFNDGSGYALVLGNSSTPDPFRIARYNNGLSGTLSNIITSSNDIAQNYYSIKITYNPSNNEWELFVRDDGTTAFADPTSGTLTSQGTAIDNNYTSVSLGYLGGYWQGSTAANQVAFFDNISVTITPFAKTTFQDGDWNTGSTWVGGSVPTAANNVIIAHDIYSNSSITRNLGTTTTINVGKSLVMSATYTNNGTTSVNGTFQVNQGGTALGNDFTYGAAGMLTFNHSSGVYSIVDTDVLWPASSGPFNVNVLASQIQLNSTNRTVSGTFTTSSVVSLNSSNLTLNGTCQINSGGSFDNAPIYGSSSTLIYNSGASFDVGNEWTGSTTTSGLGTPHNVTIQNSTMLNLPSGNRGMAGNLNVSDGTLVLSSTSGNNFYIAGNINFTAFGALIGNGRSIYFTKTGTQTITSVNSLAIPYIVFQPAIGSTTVQLLNNLTIDAPNGGNAITFNSTSDVMDLNNNTLTIGTAGVANALTGSGQIKGSFSSNLLLLGTGDMGTLSFYPSLRNLASLTIDRTSSGNVTLGTDLTIHSSLVLTNGLLTLGSSHLTLNTDATIIGSPSVSNMVVTNGVGEFRKIFNVAGSFTFPIGENTGTKDYSPATLDFTSGLFSGYAGVRVVDAKHPENEAPDDTGDYITRYWVVSSDGIDPDSYDFTGTYTAADIVNTEANSVSGRWNGTLWTQGNVAGSNTCKVEGLTTFPETNHFSAGSPLRLQRIFVRRGATEYPHTSTYDFGDVVRGTVVDVVFTIQNIGTESLTLDNPIMGGSGFTYFSPYSSLVAGTNTTTFTIRFTPDIYGPYSGSISIPNNGVEISKNPYVINFMANSICKAGNLIFKETMGSVSGITSIAVHEANDGFVNNLFTMTHGGAANPADIRATNVSSGYEGSSSGANVWFTDTPGERGFAIEGIDASGYECLTLQFGYRKESASSLPTLAVEFWNGTVYNNVPYTFIEASDAGTGWYLSPEISLPEEAQREDLRIRWRKNGSVAVRIDDVVLLGLCATVIFSCSPSSGPIGTLVTISGEYFVGTTNVRFGNVEADFVVVDDNTIIATVPDGAYTSKVWVVNPEVCTGSSSFSFVVAVASGYCFSDLFISEYVEGSSNNKYIEIYNGTGATVHLDDYMILLFNDGSSTPNTSTSLSGNLSHDEVIVYRNSGATIFGGTTVVNAAINFNGNDAIAIWKTSTSSFVDIFGCIGENPGVAWTSGSFTTLNRTLRRKSSVIGGVTVNPESSFPTLSTEWLQYDEDDVSNLGSHTYDWPGNTLKITSQPASVCVDVSDDAVFSIETTDSPDLQWYWLNNGSWEEIVGETDPTLTISSVTTGMNDYQYHCLVTDGSCTLKSESVQINLKPITTVIIDGSDVACDSDAIALQIGYDRVGYKFNITIFLDGDVEVFFNELSLPSGNPFNYISQPLIWDGPGISNVRNFSVILARQYSGCESEERSVTTTVYKKPETGPNYHIPNTFGY